MKFRSIIYNLQRVIIDSAEFAVWQDAAKWIREWSGEGKKWSEILHL